MGRARARMELIKSEKQRQNTFEKRSKSLKKMAYELSTLCGIQVCLLIYSPRDNDVSVVPKTWPENSQEIHSLIESFQKTRAKDGTCIITDFSSYLEDRTKRAKQVLTNLRKKNLRAKFPTWDEMYGNLSDEEMREFGSLLKGKIEAIKHRVEFMKDTQTLLAETSGNHVMMMMDSSYDYEQKPHQNPSYMIQNWNLSYRTTNSEFLQQQQPMPFFDPNVHTVDDVLNQNSTNFNPMVNPQWETQQFPPLMNNGASSSNAVVFYNNSYHNGASSSSNGVVLYNNSYHKSPAAAEHVSHTAGDNIGVETTPLCQYYCIPAAMQQTPSYPEHCLLSRSAPTEVQNAPETEEYYGGTFSAYESNNRYI